MKRTLAILPVATALILGACGSDKQTAKGDTDVTSATAGWDATDACALLDVPRQRPWHRFEVVI